MSTRLSIAIGLLILSATCFAISRGNGPKAKGWRTPAVFAGIAGLLSLALAIAQYATGRTE